MDLLWDKKRQQSYDILYEYHSRLTEKSYEIIKQIIGSNAIEDIFNDESDIHDMVMIAEGRSTALELTNSYKRAWGVI